MCGLIGGAAPPAVIEANLAAIAHRGPDAAAIATIGAFTLGHSRLAIQDMSSASVQPYPFGHVTLTFNGEGWRPDDLRAAAGQHEWRTTGDTEAIAALIDRLGVNALPMIEGMFALAWVDDRDGVLHLARDAYGEIPLHFGRSRSGHLLYASEVAPLLALGAVPASVRWLPPGYRVEVAPDGKAATFVQWNAGHNLLPLEVDRGAAVASVRQHLTRGVVNRLTADASIAVLASGGLDSSAVIGLIREQRPDTPIVAYTAVHDPKSADARNARLMCQIAGVELVEVSVPSPSAADLGSMVRAIEMPHKAQVEISWACWHLARRIAADGHRVVLSGEGSDEMFASYGTSYHGIQAKGWHGFRFETFTGQHRKNFPRTNKIFMRYGVEARLPFLEPSLVRYVLRLPQEAVAYDKNPKAVLAGAVAHLVPRAITHRAKVAFQTGAKLDDAAARAVADPRKFYLSTYRSAFRGVET